MRSGRMAKATRGFSLFTNWFDGLCAPLCGLWMDPGALGMSGWYSPSPPKITPSTTKETRMRAGVSLV